MSPVPSNADSNRFRQLILGMRDAYASGENAMQWARDALGVSENASIATLIAYDLQAGSYIEATRRNPVAKDQWCRQIATVVDRYATDACSILEVGCGEATTLAGVVRSLTCTPRHILGFDISWSRCAAGLTWLAEQDVQATIFVGDLFRIPLSDASVDVVYTSHSLEPNGGREKEAISELLRVARRAVVLVEPIYELASPDAQARMRHHQYVRGLQATALQLGAKVTDHRLLAHSPNPLNPSGVLCLEKLREGDVQSEPAWQCPLTQTPLSDMDDAFVARRAGLAYPVLRGIPLLRLEHAVVASKIYNDSV